jgi:integrase
MVVPNTINGRYPLYLTALAADHKPASLTRKLTSITKAHQAAGFPSPATMQHAVVSETLKGIRRTLGTAQPGKEPLLTADVLKMLDALDDGLLGCRDRALLLVGFAGGFRRSGLANLDVADVSETADGLLAVLEWRNSRRSWCCRKICSGRSPCSGTGNSTRFSPSTSP